MIKLFTITIPILFLFTGYAQSHPFAGGSGTEDNPFQITTALQLDSVRHYLKSDFILINDIDLNLPAYSNGEGWVPIGNSKTPFFGKFNGAGHTITNLYINNSEDGYLGLFACIKYASIDSLNLANCSVSGNWQYTGGLVGYVEQSTVKSCWVEGAIKGYMKTGTLLGYAAGTSIINCHTFGQTSGSSKTGGLIGFGLANSIVNCHTNSVVSGSSEIGGVVGYSRICTITDTYSLGDVIGSSYKIGGLIGNNYLFCEIYRCYTLGNVSGGSHVGGLIGFNDKRCKIKDCFTAGEISGSNNVGGLIGSNEDNNTINYCYATGKVSGSKNVGGLIGTNNCSEIASCYATSYITGTFATGGFIGYNTSDSKIEDVYFNTQSSGQTNGVGVNEGEQPVIGLSTNQMKQASSYSGFYFDSIWTIVNGSTFPRLIDAYNYPVSLSGYKNIMKIHALYSDTVNVVAMDNPNITITLENSPDGMNLKDSIISWQPDSIGLYSFTIVATDGNNARTQFTHSIWVIPYIGEGTLENPYQVSTIEELNFVRNLPKKHYKLMNDLDFAGSAYDSINSSSGWQPIGSSGKHFAGIFNGAGHSIKNLYINRESASYIGLFGFLDDASIDSLSVVNCSVLGNEYVGGLVGNSTYSSINNCCVTGTVSGETKAGGLIGSSYYTNINNCYALGNITGDTKIGGLTGVSEASTISNCYTAGNVTNTNDYSGGFVGYNTNSTKITSCYSACRVLGLNNTGAFIGYNDSTSTEVNCFFNSDISGTKLAIYADSSNQTILGLTTRQMKQVSHFSGFSFDTAWAITNGVTFPRLQSVYNYPFILPDLLELSKTGIEYSDTVHLIPMDDLNVSCVLKNSPNEMTLSDSILTWTPDTLGHYTFTITVKGTNGIDYNYTHSILTHTFQGYGTEESPFQVTTIEELNRIRFLLDKHYILMNDLDFSGGAYDSVNNSGGWEPIGTRDTPFRGSFNGAGHKMHNLWIHREKERYVGLFGATEKASIDSLAIINCSISAGAFTGAIVGMNKKSLLSNCYVTGIVRGDSYTGGLTGCNYPTGFVNNCYFIGSVSGYENLGGITGYNKCTPINNCYVVANIIGHGEIGGLVGDNRCSSTINGCYVVANVSGNTTNSGAFIGINRDSDIKNCYYNTNVADEYQAIASNEDSLYVPGLTTVQMKQESSFAGFSFDTAWTITSNATFPRLKTLYNCPIIVPVHAPIIKAGIKFSDTLILVPMDNADISLKIVSNPEGMILEDSILSWTPDTMGNYTYSVLAIDGKGAISKFRRYITTIEYLGEGTKTNPYQITTIKELDFIRHLPNRHYVLMNNLNFSGSKYDPANSISGWIPIGVETTPFRGSFDGAGNIIDKLYINKESESCIGLFGCIDEASINNLGIINCSVRGGVCTGSLVGCIGFSNINNCFASGDVSGSSKVGGLIGESCKTETTSCYASGSVYGTTNAGGLVGMDYFSNINSSYSTATVSGDSKIGGFMGYSFESIIANCYTAGDVSGLLETGYFIGYKWFNNELDGYYNKDLPGNWAGIGAITWPESTQLTGLATAQMKQDSNFASFDFDSIWTIRNDSTYPALRSVNNAPFAFADTLTGTLSSLLKNDFDYETPQSQLVHKYESIVSLATGANYTQDTSAISYADSLKIIYRVGEYLTEINDTLWGNQVTSYLVPQYPNQAPVISSTALAKATEGFEYTYVIIASDEDGDALTYSLSNAPDGMKISENKITWTPVKGTETSGEIILTVSDGELTDTETFTITVICGTGLDEIVMESISIYPNPVRSYLTIQSENTINSIQVISSLGATMYKQTACENNILLDMNNLKPGVYFIMFETNTRTHTQKIIKE